MKMACESQGMYWARNCSRLVQKKKNWFSRAPMRELPYRAFSLESHGGSSIRRQAHPLLKKVVWIAGIGTSGYFIDEWFFASISKRTLRAIYVLSSIAINYKFRFNEDPLTVEKLHEESADKLFNMLSANKGLYIKVGQAIAIQSMIFPPVFQKKFAQLFDSAPVDSWNEIDSILKSEFGKNYFSELFLHIDRNPVASASVAQVHKGVLKNGQAVAIKVQHPYISKQVNIDLLTYRLTMRFYQYIFDLPLAFTTNYISGQLLKETDFINDFDNANDLRKLNETLPNSQDIYIPVTHDSLCTSKVLVTEWIDGISLVDKNKLLAENYDLKVIMDQYITTFSKQIFKFGFVHSDPHPGNLLARFKDGKQQLVILDHGLYIKYDNEFRKQYCNLWKSLFELNNDQIKKIAESWGIGSVDLFATIVQLKPYNAGRTGEVNFQRQAEKQTPADEFMRVMRTFLNDSDKFPLELVFLGRTMRMIQTLNQRFGSPSNRVNILTKEAILNYLELDRTDLVFANSIVKSNHPSLFTIIRKFQTWFRFFVSKLMLSINSLLFRMIRVRQFLFGNQKGFEDYVEKYMISAAKTYGVDIEEGALFEG